MSNNPPTTLNPAVDDISLEMGMAVLAIVGGVLSIAPVRLVAFFIAWLAGLAIPSRSINNRFRMPNSELVLFLSIWPSALHMLLVGVGLERKDELQATTCLHSILSYSIGIVTAFTVGFTLVVVIFYRVCIGFAAVLRVMRSQGQPGDPPPSYSSLPIRAE